MLQNPLSLSETVSHGGYLLAFFVAQVRPSGLLHLCRDSSLIASLFYPPSLPSRSSSQAFPVIAREYFQRQNDLNRRLRELRQNKLQEGQLVTDSLLKNLLPEAVVTRLKVRGSMAHKFARLVISRDRAVLPCVATGQRRRLG